MDFDYFYNRDTERFSFYMLPKILVTEDLYKNLSSDAKILYACLLERSSLSFKNDWIDEQGRVYIVFTVEEIMKMLNKSNKTAVKILNELDAKHKVYREYVLDECRERYNCDGYGEILQSEDK